MLNLLSNMLNIAVPCLGIVFICLNRYNRTKVELVTYVSELIALAEKTGLTGPEKMEQVVAALYDKVPKWLRKHLNEKQLKMIAQWIFDWMRKYADAYKEASKKNENKENEQTELILAEAATALVMEMVDMTEDVLREKAAAYGIELDGKETKADIIEAIILAVLKNA